MKTLSYLLNHDKVRMLYHHKIVRLVEQSMIKKRKSGLFEKINQSALKFLVPLTLEETYETIVREAKKITQGKCGTIFLSKGKILEKEYSSARVFVPSKPRKDGYTYKATRVKRPFSVSAEELFDVYPELRESGIKSELFIPLSYQKKVIGVLTIDLLRNKKWKDEEIHLLKLLGSMASLAIRKAQLHEQTQEALIIRDKFISMAAHELKTPLTTINGYIQLLQKRMINNKSQEADWVKNLQAESTRLTELVNEMLQVSRIRAGKLDYNFTEVNITDLLLKVVDSFQALNPNRMLIFQNALRKRDSDVIVGDKEKLHQVFCQILDNAAKFSATDDPITMSVYASISHVVIEIEDKGKGISAESFPFIFEDYHKGHEENIEKGMGLGLFLCKSIIDKHKGEILLTSQLDKGTKVKVLLPKVSLEEPA